MIRIGICDDDSRARDALRWKLERLLEEEQEQIIYDFSSGTGVVQWLQKHPGQMDLLFLDVEMEPCTGLEAARQIRQLLDCGAPGIHLAVQREPADCLCNRFCRFCL